MNRKWSKENKISVNCLVKSNKNFIMWISCQQKRGRKKKTNKTKMTKCILEIEKYIIKWHKIWRIIRKQKINNFTNGYRILSYWNRFFIFFSFFFLVFLRLFFFSLGKLVNYWTSTFGSPPMNGCLTFLKNLYRRAEVCVDI